MTCLYYVYFTTNAYLYVLRRKPQLPGTYLFSCNQGTIIQTGITGKKIPL